jgi:hypothetical protein
MLYPEIPSNEEEQLSHLNAYSILDTFSESDYDNITAIASEICHTPISFISLVDDKGQWTRNFTREPF